MDPIVPSLSVCKAFLTQPVVELHPAVKDVFDAKTVGFVPHPISVHVHQIGVGTIAMNRRVL
jgi:hypothetical protein